jgi:hypothetical protein
VDHIWPEDNLFHSAYIMCLVDQCFRVLYFPLERARISASPVITPVTSDSMSPQSPTHITIKPSFCGPQAACFTGDSFLRFSKSDVIIPTASPPVDPPHATRSQLKSTMKTHTKARYDFLPLPVLSSSSRSHLCANLALGLQKQLHRSSTLLFGLARAGVVGVSEYQAFWLILYFILNLALTLYNKVLLASFPFPYTLTAVHALFGLVGGTSLRLQNVYQPKSLWGSDHIVLVAFSILYSVNIAVSNASLGLVTVPVGLFRLL